MSQELTQTFTGSWLSSVGTVFVHVLPDGSVEYIVDNALRSNPLTGVITSAVMSLAEYPIFSAPANIIVGRNIVNN